MSTSSSSPPSSSSSSPSSSPPPPAAPPAAPRSLSKKQRQRASARRAREAALTGFRPQPPQVIPVALPVRAPTPLEIAGPKPVRIAGHVPAVRRSATVATVAVPTAASRSGTETGSYPGSTPVLVNYANSARHAPGTTVWPRANPRDARVVCARYPSPAAAQTAFLAKGGPTQDPAGMDPDGDGFVCGWNPAPYRADPL